MKAGQNCSLRDSKPAGTKGWLTFSGLGFEQELKQCVHY
jgi:hypothetical protein